MERNRSWIDYCEVFSLLIATTALRFRKYLAQICGEDDTYGLKRKFLRFESRDMFWDSVCYNYGELPDGVYEASVKYYNTLNDDSLLLRDRNLVILYDDDYRMVPYGSMSQTDVLEIVDAINSGTYVMPS